MTSSIIKVFVSLSALAMLSACSAVDRISEIDGGPKFAPLNVPLTPNDNPYAGSPYAANPVGQPFSPAEPAPLAIPPYTESARTNSLWRSGSRSFFRDPRASRVGDILTVNISIADTAKLSNSTASSRKSAENAGINSLLGLESTITSILPNAGNATKLVDMGSDSANQGNGTVDRSEAINMTLAAVVTHVLPNGNLVIGGQQQVRVNSELRDLKITGIVRTEDISNANTVALAQIAEARVSYGGRGVVSDVQSPRYGTQLYNILMPF